MKNAIIISGSPRVGGNTPMPWPADQKGPEIVERILKLLESGPLRSSAIRKAVGICSGIHLSRYYLTPMMEKGRIFVSHPYNVNPNELDEMRSVLDACGVDMIWFQDSWYHENTWRIELRNAKIRSAIANGESRKVLKQGRHSVLVG